MKKIKNKGIELTIVETKKVISLLNTLESLSGSYDDYFTKECMEAGDVALKLQALIIKP